VPRLPVTERQRVLILVGEGGEGPFLRRLAEVCAGYGITPDSLHGWLRFTTDHASASTSRFLDGINHELETWRPALVHADPWYAYQPSTTESSQLTSIGAALEKVGDLCRQGGATALINHHFNRGVNGGLRRVQGGAARSRPRARRGADPHGVDPAHEGRRQEAPAGLRRAGPRRADPARFGPRSVAPGAPPPGG
jgi:RecA-family ATPase